MTFAEKLISTPQYENAGARTSERYEYQALWGLSLIFEHHSKEPDFAVAFEFHDDVLLLDSSTQPTSARFYQVKTRTKGEWRLGDLAKRKKGKDAKLLPSPLSKLFAHYTLFPSETKSLNFVSNAPCKLFDGVSATSFSSISKSNFEKFLKKLQVEQPSATASSAALMHFVVANLSLHDAATHMKGMLHNLVVQNVGEIAYNLDALYRTIVEECRSRSKYTGQIDTFDDLLRLKVITKSQLSEWLGYVHASAVLPSWETIAADIHLPAMEKAALAKQWLSYRAEALDVGNEAANQIRDAIRASIDKHAETSLSLTPLIQSIEKDVTAIAHQSLPTLKSAKLLVMILYEVHSHEPTGSV